MSEFWDRYSGKRAVLGEALINHDPYDEFAWVQSWRFAIADRLYWYEGAYVPGYDPGPMSGPDLTFAYEQLAELEPTEDQMWYALGILDRYREWLRIAGRDY